MTTTVEERTFAADTAVIGMARRFVRDHVDAAAPHLNAIDDIELAASELVSNAIEHGAGPDFRVAVAIDDSSVVIEVTSGYVGNSLPQLAQWDPPSAAAISGRGLHLVRTVSDEVWTEIGEATLLVGCRFKPAL